MVWRRSVGEDFKKKKHVWPASVIRFDLTLEKKKKALESTSKGIITEMSFITAGDSWRV